MSDKAKKNGMVAMILASLVMIFGCYLALYPSAVNAAKVEDMVKPPENEDPAAPKDENAGNKEDEEILKLMMKMKVMQKDMEDVLMSDSNRARFFDPDIHKGIIDEELLVRLLLLQEGLVEEFDRNMAEAKDKAGDKVEDDVEVPEIEDEEPVEVKELDDEELLKLALDMKVMEKELGKIMDSGDASSWTAFNPAFESGFISRPFLGRMVCLRQSFVDAFNNPFVGFRPLCPFFPRPPFFRPPIFRPPFIPRPIGFPPFRPPFVRPPFDPPFFRPPFDPPFDPPFVRPPFDPPFVRPPFEPPFARPPFDPPPFARPPFGEDD